MNVNNIVFSFNEKPPLGKIIFSAFQQLLAVLAATIAVPAIIGHGMSQSGALFGAGVGTIVYIGFTRFKSPVFLGSSFAFLGSMSAAFSGANNDTVGYVGLLLGGLFAGLIYVILSFLVKMFGTKWIDKIMPPIVIGPTVAIIGLTLAPNAISDLQSGNVLNENGESIANSLICVAIGLVTLFSTIGFSVYGSKSIKLIPFILGIGFGYIFASLFTVIGNVADVDSLKIIDFSIFKDIQWIPDFAIVKPFKNTSDLSIGAGDWLKYIGAIALAYIPVAFVVFAEHIADHKNLSFIIGVDLLETPGLHRTLLGDGVGSFVGSLFGGCPNTTYGESIACVAISGNASVHVTLATAIMAILISFFGPFVSFLATIPKCVMGGICMALYGFIAVSGLRMMSDVDLGDNKNVYVTSVILVTGVGGLVIKFSGIEITEVAFALILGILVNLLVHLKEKKV